ncbi:MAG TPA: hypothetical protein ENK12_11725 [Gammaproteobacteria bacterium]|nr:hypothetical protein [Gammaproteobacteria bacterium]
MSRAATSRLLLTMLAAALLSACGFQLRGTVTLPPVLAVTYIEAEAPYAGIAAALRRELQSAGARITDDRKEATAVIHILSHRARQRVLSVGSSGRASEYELFEEVRFELLDPAGQVRVAPQSLRMARDFVFDETQLLGKVEEANDIRRQMRASLARQIITRIGAATGFR